MKRIYPLFLVHGNCACVKNRTDISSIYYGISLEEFWNISCDAGSMTDIYVSCALKYFTRLVVV